MVSKNGSCSPFRARVEYGRGGKGLQSGSTKGDRAVLALSKPGQTKQLSNAFNPCRSLVETWRLRRGAVGTATSQHHRWKAVQSNPRLRQWGEVKSLAAGERTSQTSGSPEKLSCDMWLGPQRVVLSHMGRPKRIEVHHTRKPVRRDL